MVHGMCILNLRRDWLNFVRLPDWRVLMMMEDHQVWAIEDWSVQQKIEALVARPREFYMYQEESMRGMTRWMKALVHDQRSPKKNSGLNHLKWKTPRKRQKRRTEDFEEETIEHRFLDASGLDLSAGQLNIAAIEDFRRITASAGAQFAIIEHPGRPSFREIFVSEEAFSQWEAWFDTQKDTVRFPQPPEDGFYDMTHPGPKGRAMLSAYLVDWVAHRRRTPPAGWVMNWKQSSESPSPVLNEPTNE